ncbi:MAG: PepSY-like domain-containing protein [Rikenellaceae bacterium]
MIKRIFLQLSLTVVTLLSITSCDKDNEMTIQYSALPSSAQTTISTYFDQDQIMLITYDKSLFDKEYSVIFFDGTAIEFNKNGAWESIESRITGVPTAILPTTIADYLATNYPDQMVVEVDKETTGYDVQLDNNIELEFSTSGTLIGVDFE